MATSTLPVVPPWNGLWRVAQYTGLALTVVLLAGLTARPELTLNILWNAVVPVLPAAFLVSPSLWRNVCPLATLTLLPGDRLRRLRLGAGWTRLATLAGMVLLVVLVSTRRLLFNSDGPALAATIAAVALLAFGAGTVFRRKAGFCNSICPVLPVERLYGQSPLIRIPNVRCPTCIGCTERGCIDLSPADSIRTAIGARWSSRTWLMTPYGLFAAAFPGFIVAYFTTTDTGFAGAGAIATHIVTTMAASGLIAIVIVLGLRIAAAPAVALLGATAAGLYYWFASGTVAAAWNLGSATTWIIRLAAAVLIVLWLRKAVCAVRPAPAGPGG